MAPTIRTERLLLRPPREDDVAPLSLLLAEPEVARWWYGYDAARVRAELVEHEDDVTVMVIERNGVVAGAIQYGEQDNPDYRHANIDLFLGASARGRGLGPEAIRAVVEHLLRERGHHRVVIDPAASNARAIRAYEKAGFRAVGVMRRYERAADGTWRDGLLMDYVEAPDRTVEAAQAPLPVEVRVAVEGDVPALLDMMDVFNASEHVAWSRESGIGALRRLITDASLGVVGLITTGAEPCGYFVMTWGYDLEWSGRDAWLTELYLRDEARGRGVGAKAIEAIEAIARGHEVKALHLMVRPENERAVRLYRRAGFEAPPRMCMTRPL